LLSHDDNYPADPTYTWFDDVIRFYLRHLISPSTTVAIGPP